MKDRVAKRENRKMHKNSFAPLAAESSGEPPSDAFGPTAKDWINKIMSILESLQALQQRYGPVIDFMRDRQGSAEVEVAKLRATVEEQGFALQNIGATVTHGQHQDREVRQNQEARLNSLESHIEEGKQALHEARHLNLQFKFETKMLKDSQFQKEKELDRLVI